VGEEALIRNEEQRATSRRKRGSLSDCQSIFAGWSCCNVCTEDSEEGLERADEEGNFSVEVLMRAASRQQINGQPVVMEYWGGRHRAAAKGRELGFILCSGDHWWCIRRCSEKLDRWEEVDSLEEQIGRTWSTDEGLREDLARSRDTVLVLYTATESQSTFSTLRPALRQLQRRLNATRVKLQQKLQQPGSLCRPAVPPGLADATAGEWMTLLTD